MKRYVKILSSRDMAPVCPMVSTALTLPGTTILIAFIAIGHFLAWNGYGWKMLTWGWDPRIVPPSSGLIYLVLLILSVLAHEAGHLAVAAYRGDLSAGMYVGLRSWSPYFMTTHGPRQKRSISEYLDRPALDLAGVFSQVVFASSLGFVFLLTGTSFLPPSILLIDIAAIASLLPVQGTDGCRFILKSSVNRSRQEMNANGFCSIYASIGLCIFSIYSALSFALLISVISQWTGETPAWEIAAKYGIIEAIGYTILLLPVLQFAYWDIRGLPSIIKLLRCSRLLNMDSA